MVLVFQAPSHATGRRPSRNDTDLADGGLSLVLNGVPHLLAAGTHAGVVSQHTGETERGRSDRGGHPSRRASTLHGVSPTEICGRGSHLGSTLNPGGAVLTGGVFRRSGSVAYIRTDASPSEVLVYASWTADPNHVKPTR